MIPRTEMSTDYAHYLRLGACKNFIDSGLIVAHIIDAEQTSLLIFASPVQELHFRPLNSIS